MLAKEINLVDEIYHPLQSAAEHFNKALYEQSLPLHVFTLQRAKRTPGYFSPNRWKRLSVDETIIGEIALNPRTLSNRPLWMLFQTIVREQCHLWQHTYGTPTRPGYHNSEWAQKMENVGLVPTATGIPGGPRTGQKLSTYPIPGGPFAKACVGLLEQGFSFPWADCESAEPIRLATVEVEGVDRSLLNRLNAPLNKHPFEFGLPHPDKKKKITYRCPICKSKVWGKPDLAIFCGSCQIEYETVGGNS